MPPRRKSMSVPDSVRCCSGGGTEAKSATQLSGESEGKSTQQSVLTGASESASSRSGKPTKTRNASTGNQSMSAAEFDRRFEEGESILALGMESKNVAHPGWQTQRVNLDLPRAFLERLDRAASEREIARQALIKSWLFDRLEARAYHELERIGLERGKADE
jgi:hypothetical protein